MSTDYYLVCDKHLERTDACSRTACCMGQSALNDSRETLGPFMVTHHGCPIRIVSEHEGDAYDERFKDWTAENVDDMYMMDRE